MAKPPSPRRPMSRRAAAAVDAASWYCAVAVVALILVALFHQDRPGAVSGAEAAAVVSGRPCDEIYVVKEGETLHTISGRCNDPFIVERNPHIHDPDDIFPGLVIRLSPSTATTTR